MSKAEKQAVAVKSIIFSYNAMIEKIHKGDQSWKIWLDIVRDDLKIVNDLGIPLKLAVVSEPN